MACYKCASLFALVDNDSLPNTKRDCSLPSQRRLSQKHLRRARNSAVRLVKWFANTRPNIVNILEACVTGTLSLGVCVNTQKWLALFSENKPDQTELQWILLKRFFLKPTVITEGLQNRQCSFPVRKPVGKERQLLRRLRQVLR